MKRFYRRSLIIALLGSLLAVPSFAQKFEVYPYAGGGFWSTFRAHEDQIEKFEFSNPGLFGARVGFRATESIQIEGNVGYMPQFRIRHALSPNIHAYHFEGGVNYNFSRFGRIFPYISGGVGATLLDLSHSSEEDGEVTYPVEVPPFTNGNGVLLTTRPFTVEDLDTFFTMSYGGGIKGERLWGPVGFRFDFRGRTTPNYYGDAIHAFEPTGGILISWGER
jgi:hypothetical protein